MAPSRRVDMIGCKAPIEQARRGQDASGQRNADSTSWPRNNPMCSSEQAAHFLVRYCSPVPNKPVNPEWRRTAEEADAVFKARQALVDAFAEQRKRSEAAWNAASARMRMAWVPGRDADRRVTTTKHQPERRVADV